MAISKLLRLLKPTLGAVALATGVATLGCGAIDDTAPPPEQTTETLDATGAPIPLNPNRKLALEATHKHVTQLFLNQPSFGGGRMLVEYRLDVDVVVDVVRSPSSRAKRPDEVAYRPIPPARGKDAPPHASFQKHAAEMAKQGWFQLEDSEAWTFKKVQLVGLVVHPEPVAYESDAVPMAKTAGDIPTRSLDGFEVRGLKRLREGDDIYVETITGKQARVMGPIFAGAKCVNCHAKTGELLGAFSYTYDIGKVAAPAAGAPVP